MAYANFNERSPTRATTFVFSFQGTHRPSASPSEGDGELTVVTEEGESNFPIQPGAHQRSVAAFARAVLSDRTKRSVSMGCEACSYATRFPDR